MKIFDPKRIHSENILWNDIHMKENMALAQLFQNILRNTRSLKSNM